MNVPVDERLGRGCVAWLLLVSMAQDWPDGADVRVMERDRVRGTRTRALPPMDTRVPVGTETATFGMG